MVRFDQNSDCGKGAQAPDQSAVEVASNQEGRRLEFGARRANWSRPNGWAGRAARMRKPKVQAYFIATSQPHLEFRFSYQRGDQWR